MNIPNTTALVSVFENCNNLITISPIEAGNCTNILSMFDNCISLEIGRLNNIGNSINPDYPEWNYLDYSDCSLSTISERESIYQGLANISTSGFTLYVSMPASIGEDDSIATNKGWVVNHI